MSVFGVLDYISVGFTLLVSIGIGAYHAFQVNGKGSDDILLGGRKMGALPVGISMLVTFISATAIMGFPAEIYQTGIQLFFMKILILPLAIPTAAFIFMKVLYDLKITSVYQYLQLRYDSVLVRMTASAIFIVQCCILSGISLYAPSILLETFFGLPTWISLITIGTVGMIYTSFGGFKAVIWTDVFQFFLIVIGLIAIVVKGFMSAGGVSEAFKIAKENQRLEFFDWTIDVFESQNTLNLFLGLFIGQIGFFGTHQAHVMRYCSLPTFADALKSMAWKGGLQIITQCLIICTGIVVFAVYAGCDPLLLGNIRKVDQLVPYFYITELSSVPGMMGLFTSCILSAVLSTYSSMLNSLAAVTYSDFVTKVPGFNNLSEGRKVKCIIMLSVFYGLIITSISFTVGKLGSIFRIFYSFIGAFGGTIAATFLIGLLVPFVNKVGAMAGLITGSIITGYMALRGFLLKANAFSLPTNINSCPNVTDFSHRLSLNSTTLVLRSSELEWPTKIFTISYVLYPLIGSVITIVVAISVSLIAKQFMSFPEIESYEEYLHPIIRSLLGRTRLKTIASKDKYKDVEFESLARSQNAEKFLEPDNENGTLV